MATNIVFLPYREKRCGPGNSVGIATDYGLDDAGIGSRWGREFSAPVQTGPGAHPASCTMGTWSFPGVKSGRGVTLTLHPVLVPWSRKSRAISLLPLWAVRPVQSLGTCTRVHFTREKRYFASAESTVSTPVTKSDYILLILGLMDSPISTA